LSNNLSQLLRDEISRRDLTLNEKTYNEQQFISFPVTKESISLPFGIKYGQNISLLFSKLTSPVYQYAKFDEYQTPFLCIATDISNGESVILNSGNLAEAMRASMAIPTIFTPITIDGKLLVDGGVVNNFPAKELAERGCDIIIGVDVQKGDDFTVEDLSSIAAIIDRSVGFYRKALNDTAMKYVDYYIHPDITGYGVGSFSDYDSISKRGERAGAEHFDELVELGNYLKTFPDYRIKQRKTKPLEHFVLDSIIIEGNKEVPTHIIRSVFPFDKGDVVEMSDLQRIISQLYGNLFYNTVKYSLLPGREGVIIRVVVEESSFGSIGVGVHYDTDYNAGLLISSRFRNVLIDNTLLELAIGLSDNPHFLLQYYQNRGLLPSFGTDVKWISFSFIDYLNGKDKIGEYRFSNFTFDVYMQSVVDKTLSVGGGLQIEVSNLHNNIGFEFGKDKAQYSQTYFNLYTFLKVDRWDHSFFPHRGGKVDIRAIFVTSLLTGGTVNTGERSTILSGEYDKAIPLSPRWTLRPKINMGLSFGKGFYLGQAFLLGGQGSHYLPGMVSFFGLNVAQLTGRNLAIARMRLQYNIFKKHYLMVTADAGNITYEMDKLLNFEHGAFGYGFTYGYNSFLGPIEFSVMGSNYRGLSAFVNVGFWF